MKFPESLNQLVKGQEGKDKFNLKNNQVKKVNTLLLLAVAGVLIMIFAGVFSSQSDSSPGVSNQQSDVEIEEASYSSSIEAQEKALSTHLEQVLGQVAGVGELVVTVNLLSTSEQELAINTSAIVKTTEEKDQTGGSRIITEKNENGELVLVKTSQGGQEQPVIIKQYKPEVQGVLVVAEGAREIKIKAEIIRAVETLLNIPAHKVHVVRKESR